VTQHSNRPAKRRAAHSRTPGPRPGYRAADQAGPNAEADWSCFGNDHPSWPVGSEGPGWPQPGADYPSWPAGAGGADWPQPGADYPSWPAGAPGGGWAAERGGSAWPRQEALVVQHHDERWQTSGRPAPVATAPVPATRSGYPARRHAGAHAKTWSAQLARTQDTATQTYYELAFGDGRLQVMLTEPPKADQDWATGIHARPLEADDLRNSDAVRVAERILSDADYQAAEIKREASTQATAIREAAEQDAAEIRQQASVHAVPVREAAEREAAEIKKQAAAQAAAIREAAGREAAELRAHLLDMSAELSRVAAYVTESLTSPTIPVTKPPAPPAATPATAPVVKPSTKPSTRPAVKPVAKPRQFIAMRKVAIGATVLTIFAVAAGVSEIAQHGFKFFIFRAGGTGSTPGSVINDQQFLAREHHGNTAHSGATAHSTAKAHHEPATHHEPKGRHHRGAKKSNK
jgi:hypothetical protein